MIGRGAYRRVVEACAKLTCKTALIDGEMVVRQDLRARPLMEGRALLRRLIKPDKRSPQPEPALRQTIDRPEFGGRW
jgi:hypothetical protein